MTSAGQSVAEAAGPRWKSTCFRDTYRWWRVINEDPLLRYGIFPEEVHPAKPTIRRQHNPLLRLRYLFLKLVISPVIWATGLVYLTGLDLELVAWTHLVAAYTMATFVVVNVYMATTTKVASLRAMITGYEWVVVDVSHASEAASRSRAHSVT